MHALLRAGLDSVLAVLGRQRPMFSLASLVMYTLALAAQLPVLIARVFLATLAAIVVLELEGRPNGDPVLVVVGFAPTVWSMLALLTPVGSGWWWRTRAGGRHPSTREIAGYADAVELLQGRTLAKIAPFARGGLRLRSGRPVLARYWRSASTRPTRTRRASDRPMSSRTSLRSTPFIHDHPVPFIWLTERTHPPTEQRIDRVRALAHTRRAPSPVEAQADSRHIGAL
jgi:hypothetical protein